MVAINYFNSFFADIHNGVHNLGSDTLKIALTNTAPVATDVNLADITQISNNGGYAATALENVTSTQISGVYSLETDDVALVASGAAFDEFRYVVLFNDTATNDKLICWWDVGSAQNIADSRQFNIVFTSGKVFTTQIDS